MPCDLIYCIKKTRQTEVLDEKKTDENEAQYINFPDRFGRREVNRLYREIPLKDTFRLPHGRSPVASLPAKTGVDMVLCDQKVIPNDR